MARGHAAAEAVLHRVVGHHLEEARARVVGLVAVDVDAAAVLLRELEDAVHLREPELRGRLVVGDAADAVDAELDRVLEALLVALVREDPVLRERRHLDRAEVGELVAHAEEPAHHRVVLAGDVRVRANEERALRDRPADDLARALEDVLLGERRLQLAPDVDPLDQRARLVPARLARRERRVEMEVAVDERRRDEPALGVELSCASTSSVCADARQAAAFDREVDRRRRGRRAARSARGGRPARRYRNRVRLRIEGGLVVTMDGVGTVLDPGVVEVEDGRIAHVGPEPSGEDAETRSARGLIVVPGSSTRTAT